VIELRLLREHHTLHTPVDEPLPVHAAGKRIGTATVQSDGTLLVRIDDERDAELAGVDPLQVSIERRD
jgi:hypothetical protein